MSMRKWRLWQGSTQIQSKIVDARIDYPLSSMGKVDLQLADPAYTKTWLNAGSAINIYEGGNAVDVENIGIGSSDVPIAYNLTHGTLQSNFITLYISGTAPANEMAYTRLDSINYDTGIVIFDAGSAVGVGSTLYASYFYGGTTLFKGEIETVKIDSGFNTKNVRITGRDQMLDFAYHLLPAGTFRLGWTSVVDEHSGTGDGVATTFSLVHGTISEDSLVLYVDGTAITDTISTNRLLAMNFDTGSMVFHAGNTIGNGSALSTDYYYGGGSTVEEMVKKVCVDVGYSYTATTIPATGVITTCDAREMSGFDALKKLKEMCGSTYLAEFFINPDDNLLYFRDAKSGGAAFTRNSFKRHTYNEDSTDSYDKILYYYRDDSHLKTKGVGAKTLTIRDPKVYNQIEAEQKAQHFFELNNESRISGRVILKDWTTIEILGDIIRITDNATGQSGGSATIKRITRRYGINKPLRLGEVTYDYGPPPVAWIDILKQTRDISDYTESALSAGGISTITTTAAIHNQLGGLQGGSASGNEFYHLLASEFGSVGNHNKLDGLQGGSTDEYYHQKLSDYSGTTDGYIWIDSSDVDMAGGYGHTIVDYSDEIAQSGNPDFARDFMVPKDFVSGSFEVSGYWEDITNGRMVVRTSYQKWSVGSTDNLHEVGTVGLNVASGSFWIGTMNNIGTATEFAPFDIVRVEMTIMTGTHAFPFYGLKLKYLAYVKGYA